HRSGGLPGRGVHRPGRAEVHPGARLRPGLPAPGSAALAGQRGRAADGPMTAGGPRRTYRSPRREQQAAETRSAVISAAAHLFAERGWAATGMRDVAGAAGVSIETVYANFKSKS